MIAFAVLAFAGSSLHAQTGIITTVAGNGTAGFSGDGFAATSASLNAANAVAVDTTGNIYIADRFNHRIRKVDTAGIIITVAGNGTDGFSGDGGPATSASLSIPVAVALDTAGNIYITDGAGQRIRKVDTAGIITTVAGNGTVGFSGDGGPATSASLNEPQGVALDTSGNFYIADADNYRIRKVSTAGIITTVAGNGVRGFSGDGGLATSASLTDPTGVTLDASGNLYIADFNNPSIRKVDTAGIITTVAGNGSQGFSGDGGPATSASLNSPAGMAFDTVGNLYIADANNDRIRKVDTAGIISTVAGNGVRGFSGDGGSATSASLNYPVGVAFDRGGNLYISEFNNNRIRKVLLGTADTLPPLVTNLQATPDPVAINNPVTLTATVDDSTTGDSNIQSAQYTVNGGPSLPMTPTNGSGTPTENVTASVAPFTSDGLYNLCVTGTDAAGNSSSPSAACIILPVYDPSAGFVTGGGSVNSPAGADALNSAAVGTATFAFVSKYLKGATTPSGNLEFHFDAGSLHFKSTSMDWLVVTGEPRAQFHGLGTTNGANVCQFQVDAWDNSYSPSAVDAFGIKIYSCNSGGNGNGDRYSIAATPLSGGSIIIHK